MALPDIPASIPTIVKPASSTATYGSWWLDRFQIDSSEPTNVRVMAVLKKFTRDEAGTPVFSPVDDPVVVTVDHVLQKSDPQSSDFDPLIAQIAGVLLTNLTAYGQRNKVL